MRHEIEKSGLGTIRQERDDLPEEEDVELRCHLDVITFVGTPFFTVQGDACALILLGLHRRLRPDRHDVVCAPKSDGEAERRRASRDFCALRSHRVQMSRAKKWIGYLKAGLWPSNVIRSSNSTVKERSHA
jgi:hypothetical protein